MNTDALKEIDLRRFVTEHYPEIATNGRSSGRCPFHPHDDNPSFSIYQRANGKWAFKCHTCGTGGSIVDLVMHMAGLDFKEARKKACEMAGIPDEDGRRPIREHIYHDENGAIAYKKVKYKPGLFPFYHLAEGKWVKGKGDHPHIPFRLDKIKDEPMVYLVEGERDADTLAAIDFPATSMPCGKGDLDRSGKVLPHLAGKEVRVLYDCGNESDARAIARKLAAICPKVTLLTLPGRDPAKYHEFDITDLLDELDTEEAKRDAVYGILAAAEPFVPDPKPQAVPDPAVDEEYPGPDKSPDPAPPPAPAPAAAEKAAGNPDAPRFIIKKASEISTRIVEWIWPGVIPIGMTTLIEGDPDAGKTFILADLVARITRGMGFPLYGDQDPVQRKPGNVVYITSEGVPDQILVPRLIVAGADLERVTIIEGVYGKHGSFEILDINQHLPALAQQLEEDPDFTVLVVDPLASHLSARIDMNSSAAMRNAMDGVSRFAERMKGAPIIALHLNKDDRKSPMHRAAGSGQIMAAVKSCWAAYQKPADEDKDRRYFGPVKSTCAPARKSFAFKIQNAPITFSTGQTGMIGRVAWNLEPEDVDMKAALSPGSLAPVNKINKAIAFLRDALANGQQRYSEDLEKDAAVLDISIWNLKEAKSRERIEHARDGYQGRTLWFYPANGDKP